jgi:hypothetical protein
MRTDWFSESGKVADFRAAPGGQFGTTPETVVLVVVFEVACLSF